MKPVNEQKHIFYVEEEKVILRPFLEMFSKKLNWTELEKFVHAEEKINLFSIWEHIDSQKA